MIIPRYGPGTEIWRIITRPLHSRHLHLPALVPGAAVEAVGDSQEVGEADVHS